MNVCKICSQKYTGFSYRHEKESKYHAEVVALRRKYNLPVRKTFDNFNLLSILNYYIYAGGTFK